MSVPQLITQEKFTSALVEGITIPATHDLDLFDFGTRLVEWINITDNEYWACWNPKEKHNIIVDLKNLEILNLKLEPGRIIFLRPENGAAEELPKEFGNGAIGILLFCMMENGEIDEVPLDELGEVEEVQEVKEVEQKVIPDFDWI